MQVSQISKVVSTSAAVAVLCLAQSASALVVSPYFESWSTGKMTDAKNAAGMNHATLAFGVTRGSCAFDSGFLAKLQDGRNYVAAGGDLRISFGGQDGVYAEIACKDDNQLFAMLEKAMNDAGTRQIDFDVEGNQLLNTEGTSRRTRVLARLQAKYSDLSVSFTLPGWLRGLSDDSMNLLKTTAAAGVRIDMVNVMTMSFGATNIRTMVNPATVGQASIMSIRATASQLSTIYPNKTPAQINAMIGMTPMIGMNDDGVIFTLADAKNVADFAKLNGLRQIAFWSFQRDRAQSRNGITPLNQYSGVTQSNYQFHSIFKTAEGYVAPAPAPTPTPAPAPAPAPSGSTSVSACSSTAWVQGKDYAAGSIVSYSGKLYKANYANPGYNPTVSTYFWSLYLCGGSYSVAAPAPAPAPAPTTSTALVAAAAWTPTTRYMPGDTVVATDGKTYVATSASATAYNVNSIPQWTPTLWTVKTAASTVAIAPAQITAATTSTKTQCSSTAWVQDRQYAAGAIVSYSGVLYQAKFANPGYNPTVSTYYWARYTCK